MDSTMQAVLQFVEENDVKFIRLAFCDVMGTLKNIAIMPSELPRAFETGVSFDASSILGFAPVDKSDLFLFPDAATLSVLPWRPQTGRVVSQGDYRGALEQFEAVKKLDRKLIRDIACGKYAAQDRYAEYIDLYKSMIDARG